MDYRRRKYPNVQKNEALSIILNVFYEREREREKEIERESHLNSILLIPIQR